MKTAYSILLFAGGKYNEDIQGIDENSNHNISQKEFLIIRIKITTTNFWFLYN